MTLFNFCCTLCTGGKEMAKSKELDARIGLRLAQEDYSRYKIAADAGGYDFSTFIRKLLRVGYKRYLKKIGQTHEQLVQKVNELEGEINRGEYKKYL